MITSTEKQTLFLPDQPPRQHSYLIRCMETRSQMSVQTGFNSGWRFSLQDPNSNAVHNFRDFQSLMFFLQSVLDEKLG